MENYDPVKKQLMGLPPTPAQPIDIRSVTERKSRIIHSGTRSLRATRGFPSSRFLTFAIAYAFARETVFCFGFSATASSSFCLLLFRSPIAVVTSSAGKALGNMTPWEPSKIPFLVGSPAF